MTASLAWTIAFAAALVASLLLRTWLSARQLRHVALHRESVPAAFAASVGADAHRAAADYTVARQRLEQTSTIYGAAVLLGWTLFGGLDALNVAVRDAVVPGAGVLAYQVALIGALVAISWLLDLPFSLAATFGIEAKFGFNRTTPRLWLIDVAKSLALVIAIGGPLVAGLLWAIGATGSWWWLAAYAGWIAFAVGAQVVYPTVIAPLFNRFEPLADDALAKRVEALMARAGFAARGLFVINASVRSSHGNAYFAGLGRAKRVVFFDTLIRGLTHNEVEAVLAHELGHFKLRHVARRLATVAVASFAFFAALGWLASQAWFYTGLGVMPNAAAPNTALALLLLLLVFPVFSVFFTPLFARRSRRDEFEADAFASREADGAALASALVKLHRDNASTLTPDPVYARFWYSHPPAVERLAALPAPAA